MTDKVFFPNMIANDVNYYLIEMFRALQKGYIPPDFVSKEKYYNIKKNKDQYPAHLVGFVGFGSSFGGTWFGSYAFNNKGENYTKRTKNVLLRQIKKLKNVNFTYGNYDELEIPPNSLIYCDPPYRDTASYNAVDSFDHDSFYDWCRQMKNEGHSVYISEYNMPDDFRLLKTLQHKTLLNKNNPSQRIERLYTL